jgi:DNA repair ATPase RecN
MKLSKNPYTKIPSHTCPIIKKYIIGYMIKELESLRDTNHDLRRAAEDYSDYSDNLQDFIKELQNEYDKIEAENQQLRDELNK